MIYFLIYLIFQNYFTFKTYTKYPFAQPVVIVHGLLFGAPVLGPWCANMLSVTWAQQHTPAVRAKTQDSRYAPTRAGGQGHLASTLREKPTVSR